MNQSNNGHHNRGLRSGDRVVIVLVLIFIGMAGYKAFTPPKAVDRHQIRTTKNVAHHAWTAVQECTAAHGGIGIDKAKTFSCGDSATLEKIDPTLHSRLKKGTAPGGLHVWVSEDMSVVTAFTDEESASIGFAVGKILDPNSSDVKMFFPKDMKLSPTGEFKTCISNVSKPSDADENSKLLKNCPNGTWS